jgi:hypothetical protein
MVSRVPHSARTRTGAGVRAVPASERNSIGVLLCLPTAPGLPTVWKRGLRYVRVFWAALGQAAACLYPMMWGYRL